ncbi:MAG: hypothetical protein NTU57_03635 [Candidatus Aenigmarchaeota archaeon]|nr:hypothetical protein [Candidatus Aenigmarchaeota archaeon]
MKEMKERMQFGNLKQVPLDKIRNETERINSRHQIRVKRHGIQLIIEYDGFTSPDLPVWLDSVCVLPNDYRHAETPNGKVYAKLKPGFYLFQ